MYLRSTTSSCSAEQLTGFGSGGGWDGYARAPQLVQRRSLIRKQQMSPSGKQQIARHMPQQVKSSVKFPACTEYYKHLISYIS